MRLYFIIKAKIKPCLLSHLFCSQILMKLSWSETHCLQRKMISVIASMWTYLKWHLWFWLSRLITNTLLPLPRAAASCHMSSKGNARICMPPGEALPVFLSSPLLFLSWLLPPCFLPSSLNSFPIVIQFLFSPFLTPFIPHFLLLRLCSYIS